MRYSLLLALAACGGSSSDTVDVKLANTVVAAVRTGDTWKSVTRNAAGEATIDVDGPTMLATVCDDGSFFNYYTLFLGPGIDDTVPLDFSCGSVATGVTVTVAAPSTTQVFIGFLRNFSGGPLTIPAGTHDVIAVDASMTPARFEIRRDVAITANMTLTFDLAATGTPMTATPIEATGAATGETPSRRTSFVTAKRTFASIAGTPSNGWLFPPSAITTGDKQTVSVATSSETLGSRSARRTVAGTESMVTLALPDYLATVTPTATSVVWSGGAKWESFYYNINSPDFRILWDVSVFKEWTAAGGKVDTIAFPDPTGIPGWQPAWNLGATTGYDWFFSASENADPDFFDASRSGEL